MIEIDLSTLTPLINGPDTPDLVHAVGDVGAWARGERRADRDLDRARRLVHQLVVRGHHARRVDRPLRGRARPARQDAAARDARLGAGARDDRARRPARRPRGDRRDRARQRVRAVHRAVGPPGVDESKLNTIVSSYNRNFSKRNDGRAITKAFVTSPETVDRVRARGHARLRPAHRRDRRRAPRTAGRRRPARARASTRARRASSRRPPTAAGVEVVGATRQRAAAAARRRSPRGTAPTTSTCPCC